MKQIKQTMKRMKNLSGDTKGDSMRETIVLITICGWLFAGAAFAVEGGGKDSSAAGTVKSPVFNVLNYGAVGDDKTDNTEAFSACLKAMIAAGGGKMVLADGVYRGRIIIPPVSKSMAGGFTSPPAIPSVAASSGPAMAPRPEPP